MATLTEAELVSRILETLAQTIPVGTTICTELDGILCRPDITTFTTPIFPTGISPDSFRDERFGRATAIILAILQTQENSASLKQLLQDTGYTKPYLQRRVQDAADIGIIDWTNDQAQLVAPLTHNISTITSYEIKLSNWRRAIHQTRSYRTFSHQAYIAMPASGVKPAVAKAATLLRHAGTGLLRADEDGAIHTVIPATTNSPNSFHYYYLALSKALQQAQSSHDRDQAATTAHSRSGPAPPR